ncbi:MAG: LysR family transcriptional regulator [Faecalicatena sp.]|uniref:LysR family transcriptional regulator n=1 Tax=Faecalicatena sp. TaxID=2005360 RepID=UPI0025902E12|nr:LysR family transcriptional regulator [Faecalicatena sp.]MCI6465772.1 LysR family transcriptional regulator [Faecalicatena sp.]MDY5618814.1 LysR family transcriptional regulator [Lachnospiraceae bacterium]
MTFDQLNYFIAVVEENTFFDAAEALHISQSSLSKQIIKLEKELDITLLDRSHRSAVPTEAGQLFYQEALQLRKQYDQAISKLQNLKKQRNHELRIGTLPILSHYHLTPLLKQYSELHTDLILKIDEVEEKELISGFESEKYDLVIAREHLLNGRSCKIFTLTEDELTAVLPLSHRYAGAVSVRLFELSHEDFILMNPYTSVFQLCMEEFARYSLSPNIIRNARVESILGAVAVNEGISLLPKSNFEIFQPKGVIAVPLAPPVKLPVVAAHQKKGKLGQDVEGFIRFLQTALSPTQYSSAPPLDRSHRAPGW